MSSTSETPVKRRRSANVTRPYGGVHADIRRQERRTRLIAAGLEVIGTRGYHLSTVADICAQSGLSKRYFYESFKGMDALFEAVYAELHTESQSLVMGAFVGSSALKADPMQMAEVAVTAWLTFIKEDPRRARILLIEAVSINDASARNAQAAVQDFAGIIRSFVETLYPGFGELGYEPKMIAATLAGASLQAAKAWMRADFAQSVEHVTKHLTLVFRSLHDFYGRETRGEVKTVP